MKLDTKTLNVLKNFATINPSILIKQGSTLSTMAPSKTIMAKAEVPVTFDHRFAIYDLSQFLGVLSLFTDPELTFVDNQVVIRSGQKKVTYTFAAESTIIAPPDKEIKLPKVDVEFELKEDVLKEVTKALRVLSLPEIAFVGDGEKVSVQAVDSKTPTGHVFSSVLGETDKKFRFIFKEENIKVISDTYHIQINSKGISKFTGKVAEYFIAVEQSSTFEG